MISPGPSEFKRLHLHHVACLTAARAERVLFRRCAAFWCPASQLASHRWFTAVASPTTTTTTVPPPRMSRLSGKCVFITGASAGIGEACAREFAKSGSNLVLTSRRVDRLDKLKQEIHSTHPNVKVHCAALDVRNKENVDAVFKNLPIEFTDVDVLVNNAGLVFGLDHVANVRKEDMDIMLDTNVKGVIYCTQAALLRMKERNRGHIINVSSIAGKDPYAGGSVYCATKHAVEAITKSLRLELVDTGIRVCSIAPGLVETEFSVVRFRGDKAKADKVYEGLEGGPLTGQDIAETIVFVASRPEHVQIADVLIFPTSQASATTVARKSL